MLTSTQNNLRQATRYQPRQAVTCNDINGLEIGRVMNLSETGFMLMSNQTIEVNETLILRIDLPLNPTHQITATCEVIWGQKSSFSNEYGMGVQIKAIDDLGEIALKRYLNDTNRATAA